MSIACFLKLVLNNERRPPPHGDYVYFKSQVPLHKIPIRTKRWRYYYFGPKAVLPLICLLETAGTADVYYKQAIPLSMKTSPVGAIKVRESEVFEDQKNDGGKVSGCTGGKSDANEDLDDLFWDDNNRFSAPDLGITETSHSGEKPVDHNQGSEETQSWAMGVL
ncbi:hypothetical protein SAY86_028114 [Trapa natans]|uniref:Uncharacterized protein n=1 Tax=Trapa natans TaxID=22666 RepID=A0AAN7MGI6_TRANT|nr:hypothetical protein SAY86_028114 [Trapa natans]